MFLNSSHRKHLSPEPDQSPLRPANLPTPAALPSLADPQTLHRSSQATNMPSQLDASALRAGGLAASKGHDAYGRRWDEEDECLIGSLVRDSGSPRPDQRQPSHAHRRLVVNPADLPHGNKANFSVESSLSLTKDFFKDEGLSGGTIRESGEESSMSSSRPGTSSAAQAQAAAPGFQKAAEGSMELIYDPELQVYFDPKTGAYYASRQ